MFNEDSSLNLDVYVDSNYERLGFPSKEVFLQEIEYEVRKCILKIPIEGDAFVTKVNSYKQQLKQAEKKKLTEDVLTAAVATDDIVVTPSKVVPSIDATEEEIEKIATPNAEIT